ncbi:unnamed protein product [Dovyalis caffra]|uniref:Uncharacterized protein n=1 Tax=Dovyalis caffra TaxID=77055 RepID=A0AAV1SR66_9ROSI|nr:unnamed protein product [Dovyalis caffra]
MGVTGGSQQRGGVSHIQRKKCLACPPIKGNMTLKAAHEPSKLGCRGAEVHQWCTKLKILDTFSFTQIKHDHTAYSLEDNKLCSRQVLRLSTPLFVAGIIKYGDRTWVLMCSTTKNTSETFTQQLLCGNQGLLLGNILLLVNYLHQAAYSKFIEVELGFIDLKGKVEIGWKGSKLALSSLRKTLVKKNFTKEVEVQSEGC